MISMAFEREHRVLLARLIGVFSSDDIAQLDAAVRRFVLEEGATPSIVDWSEIKAIAVPESRLVERGRLPQIALGQLRVMVAPQQEVYEMMRAYADQQRVFGNVEPAVVRTIVQAYDLLGLIDPQFEPVCFASCGMD